MIDTKKELDNLCKKQKYKALDVVSSNSFVFSEIQKADILITGINPSKRKSEEIINYHSFKYQELIQRDNYFQKIHGLFPKSLKHDFFTYTDLFYHRNTQQSNLRQLDNSKNSLGVEFLAEQLNITYKRIEYIQPKLITVFNKGSWKYWGKIYNPDRELNVWMGYQFKKVENFKNLYQIISSIDSGKRVSSTPTQLKDTFVFFSTFIGYLSSEKKQIISDELQEILKYIDLPQD